MLGRAGLGSWAFGSGLLVRTRALELLGFWAASLFGFGLFKAFLVHVQHEVSFSGYFNWSNHPQFLYSSESSPSACFITSNCGRDGVLIGSKIRSHAPSINTLAYSYSCDDNWWVMTYDVMMVILLQQVFWVELTIDFRYVCDIILVTFWQNYFSLEWQFLLLFITMTVFSVIIVKSVLIWDKINNHSNCQ